MSLLRRFVRVVVRPAHIGWGGDLKDVWATSWTPGPWEIR